MNFDSATLKKLLSIYAPEEIAKYIQSFVPKNGITTIFFLTDRQFAMTKNYFGGLKAEIKTPEQGILLF